MREVMGPNGNCRACLVGRLIDFVVVPDFEYRIAFGRYGRCDACGSYTQNPMPDDAKLASYYPPTYHSFLPINALIRKRQAVRIGRLRKMLGSLDGIALLDFGCGQGAFLDALAEAVPEGSFYGYEIAEKNAAERTHGGRVTIYRGSLDATLDGLPPLDVVVMNHVIEHLPDPSTIVGRLVACLKPGGAFEGQTPNANSYERRLFGRRWAGFHSPRHTVVFSKEGLDGFLRRFGFTEPSLTSTFSPAGWAISIGSALQNGERPAGIRREGLPWLTLLAAGTIPNAIDSLTSNPGVVDFFARRP
jgi:SAM-dependent methyltransferase